jgi:PAS domain S-box-containing protein
MEKSDFDTKHTLCDGLFKTIIEHLPYPAAIFSADGITQYVNSTFVELFGYELKDIITREDWREKAYPEADYKNSVVKEIEQWEASGRGSLNESRRHITCRDGSTKDAISYSMYLPQDYYCLIFTDITELVRNQKKLKESEERFRTLYKSTPVPGFLWQLKDGDFELIDYNQSGYKLTKGKIVNLLGSRGRPYFHDVPHVLEDIERCYREKTVIKNEYPYKLRSTGEELYIAAYCAFLPKDMVSLFQVDITEHINIEEALRESERKLDMEARRLEEANVALKVLLDHRDEEKMRIQEDVMYTASRLITPFVNKLKRTDLTAEQLSLLNTIETNLGEIIAPFAGNLSYRIASLTATEMEVAALVKEGKRIKQIATIMCISEDAVCFHRKNIRSKLGLKHKKINLHSFLQQMVKK